MKVPESSVGSFETRLETRLSQDLANNRGEVYVYYGLDGRHVEEIVKSVFGRACTALGLEAGNQESTNSLVTDPVTLDTNFRRLDIIHVSQLSGEFAEELGRLIDSSERRHIQHVLLLLPDKDTYGRICSAGGIGLVRTNAHVLINTYFDDEIN